MKRCQGFIQITRANGVLKPLKLDALLQVSDCGKEGLSDLHAKLRGQLIEELPLGRSLCHVGLGLQLPGVVAGLGHQIQICFELRLRLLAMM